MHGVSISQSCYTRIRFLKLFFMFFKFSFHEFSSLEIRHNSEIFPISFDNVNVD